MNVSFSDFLREFPSEDACLKYIFDARYKNSMCPKCKKIGKFYHNRTKVMKSVYTCSCGRSSIRPRKGTIFQDSKLDLHKWFIIIFLVSKGKHSAIEIAKMAGTSYPTAWSVQNTLMKVMMRSVKDVDVLKWRPQVKSTYRKITEENIKLYASAFQFRADTKKDPFYRLLNLII